MKLFASILFKDLREGSFRFKLAVAIQYGVSKMACAEPDETSFRNLKPAAL